MKKDDTYKQVVFSDKKIKTYEKTIKETTAEKKAELNRALDNMVDQVFDKKYLEFLKDIKVKKELDALEKSTKELRDFERSIEMKKESLKDAVKSNAKKVQVICERQSKINGFDVYFGYGDYDFDDFSGKLQKVCRDELTKQFRKSTKEGKELDTIDANARNLILTLSYPNLMAKAVDLNEALKNGSNMLSICLNPNTLKQIEN